LALGELGATGFRKVAEGDAAQAVAARANLAIDLEAALQLGPVVGAEGTGEAPALARRLHLLGRGGRHRRNDGGCEEAGDEKGRLFHVVISPAPQGAISPNLSPWNSARHWRPRRGRPARRRACAARPPQCCPAWHAASR